MGNYLCCCICLNKADDEVILEKNKSQSSSSNKGPGVKIKSPPTQYYPNDFKQITIKNSNLEDKNKVKEDKDFLEIKPSVYVIEESKEKDHLEQDNEKLLLKEYSSEKYDLVNDIKSNDDDFLQKAYQNENLLQDDKVPLKNVIIENHDSSVNQISNDDKTDKSNILENHDEDKLSSQNNKKEPLAKPISEDYDLEVNQINEEIKNEKVNILENINQEANFLSLRGKVIMVIGETGTGKSSILNLLGNTLENTDIKDMKIYFKLKKIPILSDEIYTINDKRVKTIHQSKIIHTNSIRIVEIKTPLTNNNFTLIDTPGILSETNGSADEQFIEIIKELLNVVKKIDCLIFLEKSNSEACSRSIEETISRLEEVFSKKVSLIVPVFTFYPGSLVFDKDNIPFTKEMKSEKTFKINNMIFGYTHEDRVSKAGKLNKIYEKLKKIMEKIMDIVDN
ncbi:hypothetical protein SteCoe_35677 [Stentor coeruleus]|uniref:Uncharacterized protein n=1 Tax=Stentor coeruleus TaxID=5963 RepID=A0A1R2ARV4_9CILI|nr:hypothetical protein SteCoe_35677 [Stentor coeruleus]